MRCLVIDDDIDMARYICDGLLASGYGVTLSREPVEATALVCNELWDIVILDRLLPGQTDGLAILKKLRNLGRQTPVLILSALTSVDERVRGLKAGGDDYLAKPFAFPELLARIEALLRRSSTDKEATHLQIADLILDVRAMRVSRGNNVIALQPREFRLLEYLMRNEGRVLTRAMLLENVWDYHFDPQTNVIDVQVSRLRNKIDKDFVLPLIHTVRGVGYLISGSPQAGNG